MKRIVDTNVLKVANDLQATGHPACVLAATQLLRDIQQRGHLLVDADFEILREYMKLASERGQPGVGDAFLKWAKSNEYNVTVCTRVPITPHPDRVYEEFPDDHSNTSYRLDVSLPYLYRALDEAARG